MSSEAEMAILLASMVSTLLISLFLSRRYREDTAKMLRLEKTTFRVFVENPIPAMAFILSFFLPLAMMGLL